MASSSARITATNWLLVRRDNEDEQYRGDQILLDLTIDTTYDGRDVTAVRMKGLEVNYVSVAAEYALLAITKDAMFVFPSIMVSSVDAFGVASQFITVPVNKPGTHYAMWKIGE